MAGKRIDRAGAADANDDPFVEERRRLAAYAFQEANDQARRLGVAAHDRRRVLGALAKKSGVSLAELDALHAADWATVQRQVEARTAEAAAILKEHHARQRATFDAVMADRERFEFQGGNPTFQTCMWRAVNPVVLTLLPFTFNQGQAGLAPPAPVRPPPAVGRSVARFTARAEAAAAGTPTQLIPVAGFELVTSHAFETTARADGILSVTAHFAPLGTIFLGAPGDCYGFGGSASAEVTLFMDIRITTPEGRRIDVPRGDTRTIVDERIHAGCDGENRLVLVGPSGGSAYQLAQPDAIAVREGDTIGVTARYALRLSTALRGVAVATFAGAPNGLNVAVVLAKIVT